MEISTGSIVTGVIIFMIGVIVGAVLVSLLSVGNYDDVL